MIDQPYSKRLRKIHRDLMISDEFIRNCKMPVCDEAQHLVVSEPDYLDREQRMTPATLECWTKMKTAAAQDQVMLYIVSAFRSVEYQRNLIQAKLDKGQLIDDILKVNAAPGLSEHHTGRAIDITTDDCEALSEMFEQTDAYRWLTTNAAAFDFKESYPRGNRYGIVHEPWHWSCTLD